MSARTRSAGRGPRRALLCALLAGTCTVLGGCSSVFLYPDRVQYLRGRELGTLADEVWLRTVDGERLHALFLHANGAPRATVLFLHGNAENLSSHIHAVTWLPAVGFNVLALDYRGYGQSGGHASVDGVHDDAALALGWLIDHGADRTGPLIVYGQSLGGAVAIELAARSEHPPRLAAVVADSAFSSYRGIAREKLAELWLTWPLQLPLSWLIDDRHAPLRSVAQISPVPLLLIHGDRDMVVPPEHARRLYAAAKAPKDLWLIEGAAHIEAVRREATRRRLVDFLNAAITSAGRGP